MAIASLPPTYLRAVARNASTTRARAPAQPVRPLVQPPKRGPARAPSAAPLPPHHVADLRDIALGVEESNAGICTKYLLDQSSMSGGDDEGGHLHDIERCLDRYSVFAHAVLATWHTRIKRARRALATMNHAGHTQHVAVLHVAFGAEDPMTREWPRAVRDYYGAELTSLVRYTDATEERRKRLVKAASMVQRMQLAGLSALTELRNLVRLSEVREREAYHDRIITSGDALRDALSAAQVSERPGFMAASKRDAEAMLSAACGIYHRAWLSTP